MDEFVSTNKHLAFPKGAPVRGIDIFDFKKNHFCQVIPDGEIKNIFIKNDTYLVEGETQTNKIDLDLDSTILLASVLGNKLFILDISMIHNRPLNKHSLKNRISILTFIKNKNKNPDITFIFPEDLSSFKGFRTRFVKDKSLDIVEFPDFLWEETYKLALKIDNTLNVLSIEGKECFKNFNRKLDKTDINKTYNFVFNGKNLIKQEETHVPDTNKHISIAIQGTISPLKSEDLISFIKNKKIPEDFLIKRKREILLINTTKNKENFITYKHHDFNEMRTTSVLDTLYEIKKSELAIKIKEIFKELDLSVIRDKLNTDNIKISKLIDFRGCITCGIKNTIIRCEGCNQKIVCKDCAEIMGTTKKCKCDFCGNVKNLTNNELFEAGIITGEIVDFYANVSLNDIQDPEEIFRFDITKLYELKLECMKNIFKKSEIFCEISLNFGVFQKQNFNKIATGYNFIETKRILCKCEDTEIKYIEGDKQGPYKKTILKQIEENKFDFKIKLKYCEITRKEQQQTIVDKIHLTEYTCKFGKGWNLILRKSGKIYEIVLMGPDDSNVNEIIRKLFSDIYSDI